MGGGTVIPPWGDQVISSAEISAIMAWVNRIFATPINWFQQLLISVGLNNFWVACLFMFMVARFFLVPLFGRSLGHELDSWIGSDKAQKSLPKNDIDNDPYGGHI